MRFDIAIVGGGPNATYALDRLSAVLARTRTSSPLRVAVFERTGCFGDGAVHDSGQPATSYLNRACGDVALGGDDDDAAVAWCRGRTDFWTSRPSRRDLDGAPITRPYNALETPSRALHGAAIAAAFRRYLDRLSAAGGHSCTLLAEEVTAIENEEHSDRLSLVTSTGARHSVAYVLLATGHGQPRPAEPELRLARALGARYVDWPYPLTRLDALGDLTSSDICVDGLGLSAIDIFLYLTEGQGGQFERAASGRLDYRPSGREPRYLTGVSTSGLLISARPLNEKVEHGVVHRGIALTAAAIAELRERRGLSVRLPGGRERRQLDFERDLLPLIVLEMALLYHSTGLPDRKRRALEDQARRCAREFLAAPRRECRDSAIDSACAEFMPAARRLSGLPSFDWRDLLMGPSSAGDWHSTALRAAEDDLADAHLGNLSSPLKAAADGVWRDLRPLLQEAIDFGGLLAESEEVFQQRYLRVYNRVSNGCCIEAMEKVVCLARNGFLDLGHGPGARIETRPNGALIRGLTPRKVSVVIRGRLSRFDAQSERAPLYRAMLRAGLLTQWVNPGVNGAADFRQGAITISTEHFAVNAAGIEDRRLSLIGTPIDGVRYFQETLARPGRGGAVFDRLNRWAEAVTLALHTAPS